MRRQDSSRERTQLSGSTEFEHLQQFPHYNRDADNLFAWNLADLARFGGLEFVLKWFSVRYILLFKHRLGPYCLTEEPGPFQCFTVLQNRTRWSSIRLVLAIISAYVLDETVPISRPKNTKYQWNIKFLCVQVTSARRNHAPIQTFKTQIEPFSLHLSLSSNAVTVNYKKPDGNLSVMV